ncbi:MAG: antibiotic biosynthesis monooxygenase [Pseudomonadota bacterium]
MDTSDAPRNMIMRLFHVRTKADCAADLIDKFATTSADVVQHEPGNKGYFFGQGVGMDKNVAVFASFWTDLDAVKARFGSDWQVSFLPEGYEELIEECWVEHIDVATGWFVRPDQPV